MLVGVPKEIKTHEYRVGLTPAAVRELVVHGHLVKVQKDAASAIGFSDDDYRAAGATIEPMPVGEVSAQIAHEAVAAEHEEAQANLDAVQAQMAAEGVTNVRTVIREGFAGDEIVAAATEANADVVIIATHGRSGLKRAVLGSVADHVLHQAPCPVLLCRSTD